MKPNSQTQPIFMNTCAWSAWPDDRTCAAGFVSRCWRQICPITSRFLQTSILKYGNRRHPCLSQSVWLDFSLICAHHASLGFDLPKCKLTVAFRVGHRSCVSLRKRAALQGERGRIIYGRSILPLFWIFPRVMAEARSRILRSRC